MDLIEEKTLSELTLDDFMEMEPDRRQAIIGIIAHNLGCWAQTLCLLPLAPMRQAIDFELVTNSVDADTQSFFLKLDEMLELCIQQQGEIRELEIVKTQLSTNSLM